MAKLPYGEMAEAALRNYQRHEAHVNATWRPFRRDLASALHMSEAAAEKAAIAVVCALEHRLTEKEAKDLESQLPIRLVSQLRDCGAHTERRGRKWNRDEFLAAVAEHSDLPHADAEQVTRGVFHVLAQRVSEGEIKDVISQLPKDLRALWPENVSLKQKKQPHAARELKQRQDHLIDQLKRLPVPQRIPVIRAALSQLLHELSEADREKLWWELSVSAVSGKLVRRRQGNRDVIVTGRA